jgi:hypothetical protein
MPQMVAAGAILMTEHDDIFYQVKVSVLLQRLRAPCIDSCA